MNSSATRMTAIVLAGQRDGEDALAEYAGASCKAVIEIAGIPMLTRVLKTLRSSSSLAKIVVSGPSDSEVAKQKELSDLIRAGDVSWTPPQASPSRSAYHVLCQLPSDEQVLLTTADHPLLTPEIVDDFCTASVQLGADLTVGLAPYSLVHDEFPEMKKTVLRFKGAELCGCNLFAFLTPAGREVAHYWREVEAQRKNPLRVIRILGWLSVVKYFFGMLTLDDALKSLSRNLGLQIRAVILPYADAAVDVDSVSDYSLVQAAFQARKESTTRT
jgi:molybdopterin-guanine dinucleotide biosynthesis protein A